VNDKNEFPLKAFKGRTDFASKAIGYGKAAMVFHMLRMMTGDEVFYQSLRDFIDAERFRRASWDDIKKAFEKNYKKDLEWFFRQWIERPGLPHIRVENAGVKQSGDKYDAAFAFMQKDDPFDGSFPGRFDKRGSRAAR
jgi:aminopeptidase N